MFYYKVLNNMGRVMEIIAEEQEVRSRTAINITRVEFQRLSILMELEQEGKAV